MARFKRLGGIIGQIVGQIIEFELELEAVDYLYLNRCLKFA